MVHSPKLRAVQSLAMEAQGQALVLPIAMAMA